jgi:DNA adenine methylase
MSAPCKPFLKWPGGKRWAAFRLAKLVARHLADQGTYFEPFLGGGAVYFHLQPAKAVLADINSELINVYKVVRKQPHAVISEVKKIRVGRRTYYRIRDSRPKTDLARAIRFLYLNRVAWGGIYRVNELGKFNVPYGGRSTSPLWRDALIDDASKALRDIDLKTSDFADTMRSAKRGDVVFCDPTYAVATSSDGFVRYNGSNFSWEDQLRLSRVAHAAQRRGASVIITNAWHASIRELYPDANRYSLRRFSAVSRAKIGRKLIREYLLVLPGG